MKNAQSQAEFNAFLKKASMAELLEFYNKNTGKSVARFSSRADGEKRCLAWFVQSKSLFAASEPATEVKVVRRNAATTVADPNALIHYVEIVDTKKKEVVRRFGPMSQRTAEKTKKGAEINLNHEECHVRITEEAAPALDGVVDTGRRAPETAIVGRRQSERRASTIAVQEKKPRQRLETPIDSAQRSAAIKKSWENPDVKEKRATRHNVVAGGVPYRSVRQAFVELRLPLKDHIAFRMALKEKGKAIYNGISFTAEER